MNMLVSFKTGKVYSLCVNVLVSTHLCQGRGVSLAGAFPAPKRRCGGMA